MMDVTVNDHVSRAVDACPNLGLAATKRKHDERMNVSSQKIALPLLATSHKSGTDSQKLRTLGSPFHKILKIPPRSRMNITKYSSSCVVLITLPFLLMATAVKQRDLLA
jgi:hypothetical protein